MDVVFDEVLLEVGLALQSEPQGVGNDQPPVLIAGLRVGNDQLRSLITDKRQLANTLRSDEIIRLRLKLILTLQQQPLNELIELGKGLRVEANHLLEDVDIEVDVFHRVGCLHELAHEFALVAGDDVADRAAHCVAVLVGLGSFKQLEKSRQDLLGANVAQGAD